MSHHSSVRGLFTLLSGVSVGDSVIQKELGPQENSSLKIQQGILWKPSSGPSSSGSSSIKSRKLSPNFASFLVKLDKLLGKGEEESFMLLMCYLSGDFRGTRDSLKCLIDQERLHKALIIDIWQFYRAERLYLLQVLKLVLINSGNLSHRHHSTYTQLLKEWSRDGKLKGSLMNQLESVINEEFNNQYDLYSTWLNYNLRETAELLQLLLLYYHHRASSSPDKDDESKDKPDDLKKLLGLFQNHGFGHNRRRNESHYKRRIGGKYRQIGSLTHGLFDRFARFNGLSRRSRFVERRKSRGASGFDHKFPGKHRRSRAHYARLDVEQLFGQRRRY